MKNTVKIFIVLLTVILSLTSCPSSNPIDGTLNTIATALENGYDSYTFTVCVVTSGGHKVNEEYRVSEVNGERKVDYVIEKINGFTVTEDGISAPDAYKTVTEGTLSAKDAVTTDFSLPKFDFSSRSLANIGFANSVLTADIISLQSFIGADIEAENVTLAVSVDGELLNYIAIYYTTPSGNKTTLKYIFQ